MSANTPRLIASILTGLFLVLPTLLVLPPGSATFPPADTVAQDEIENKLGQDAPYGSWITKTEPSRMYLHFGGSGTIGGAVPDPGFPITPGGSASSYMDFEAPLAGSTDSAQVSVGPRVGPCDDVDIVQNQSPVFPGDHIFGVNTTLYEVGMKIFASAPPAESVFLVDIGMINITGDLKVTCFATFQLTDAAAHGTGVYSFAGTRSFGLDGVLVPPGHNLFTRVYTAGADVIGTDPFTPDEIIFPALEVVAGQFGDTVMYYGSAADPAYVDIKADTARINLWTEDRHNQVRSNFPAGTGSSTSDRRVEFNALVYNSMGVEDCPAQNGAGGAHDPNLPNDLCPYDNFNEDVVRFRVRDLNPDHTPGRDPTWSKPWKFNEYIPLDQGLGIKNDPGRDDFIVRCCDLEIEPIRYNPAGLDTSLRLTMLQHTFVYPADFPSGRYQIEFHEAQRNWKATTEFTVGATGFTFEFAPGEAEITQDGKEARHLVHLGESTEYVVRVTNNGANTDTFGVTVPTPDFPGLSAYVTPNTAAIEPGASVDFTVTVVPPPAGSMQAGQFVFVYIEGVSLKDNKVKQLITKTTYTGQTLRGVELTGTRPFIETRPDMTETFPVLVRNIGTVKDNFILTAKGVPAGWTVDLRPAYTQIFAASREDVIAQIHVPAEAIPPLDPVNECAGEDALPGCPWTLFIEVRSAADAAIMDVIEIPVTIYLIDGLDLDVLAEDQSIIELRHSAHSLSLDCLALVFCSETHADVEFDDAVLFRVKVSNTGDREDKIQLSASWNPLVGKDEADCDIFGDPPHNPPNRYDGVPDLWRYRILDGPEVDPDDRLTPPPAMVVYPPETPGPTPQYGAANRITNSANDIPFSGELSLGELKLDARSSQYIWIELKYIDWADDGTGSADDCQNSLAGNYRTEEPSPEAELRVTYRSKNDPTLRATTPLRAVIPTDITTVTQSGTITEFDEHGVLVHLAYEEGNEEPRGLVQQPDRFAHPFKVYTVHAVNMGNEHDDMTIRVDKGINGWTHSIQDWTVVPGSATQEPVDFQRTSTQTGNVGAQARNNALCKKPSTPDPSAPVLQLACNGMGIHDEVILNILVKPPFEVDIGEVDDLPITVTSRGPGGRVYTDDLVIQTRVQGDFFFDLEDLAGDRITYPGQTIAFPFTIHNLGTERDEYQIDILEAAPQPGGQFSLEAVWNPQLCASNQILVPGGLDYHGCLAATVPLDWDTSDDDTRIEEVFRIKVRSLRGPLGQQQSEILDFFAQIDPAPGYTVDSQVVTIRSNDDADFDVTTTLTNAAYEAVEYAVDPATMPDGFVFSCNTESQQQIPPTCNPSVPEKDVRFFNSAGKAIGDMTLNAPADQLGNSRVVSRIQVTPLDDAEEGVSWHDAVTNLATVYGLTMDVKQLREQRERGVENPKIILPPGPGLSASFDVILENPGLSPETVNLANSALPEGWTISPSADTRNLFIPSRLCPASGTAGQVCVSPLQVGPEAEKQNNLVRITVQTSNILAVGDTATIIIFGEVAEDPSKKAQVVVPIEVGTFAHTLTPRSTDIKFVAPQERVIYTLDLENTGNVHDVVNVTLVPPPAYQDIVVGEFSGACVQTSFGGGASGKGASCEISIAPDTNRTIQFSFEVPEGLQPNVQMPFNVETRSMLAGAKLGVGQTVKLRVQAFSYAAQDIDGDLLKEFAIDRNRNPADGYEEFRENLLEGGITARWLHGGVLSGFLSDAAVTRMTRTNVQTGEEGLIYDPDDVLDGVIDFNNDGRADHLLDFDGDNLPDAYWDPFNFNPYLIVITKDVTKDGVREYFLDVDANCLLDSWFDIVDGRIHKLIQTHTDEDSFVDYIVDLNRNGLRDTNDVIIKGVADPCTVRGLTQIGQIVEYVDMNGDGLKDTVIDSDGDGDPDYFIPNGKNTPIPITLKDVTGDGNADWTYPSKGEGKPDSYYDPVNKKSGFIDAQSQFLRDLQKYWWIAGLFVFVALLFVVLVAVTRR